MSAAKAELDMIAYLDQFLATQRQGSLKVPVSHLTGHLASQYPPADVRMWCVESPREVGDFQLGAGAGVEPVAPGIAQEIEGRHGGHDGARGKEAKADP